jgi:hypothetical protein
MNNQNTKQCDQNSGMSDPLSVPTELNGLSEQNGAGVLSSSLSTGSAKMKAVGPTDYNGRKPCQY